MLCLIGALAILGGLSLPDGNLHLIACDVGEGDATLIVYGSQQILIDGGPEGSKVLGCLGKYVPFWDRKIEAVILTHPQLDHFGGLIQVFEHYKVDYFLENKPDLGNSETEVLEKAVEAGGAYERPAQNGTNLRMGLLHLDVLFPNAFELALGAANPNDVSVVALLSFGKFEALLTGDASRKALDEVTKSDYIEPVEYIKVPHHGSKNGLTEELLKAAKPVLAVISVGKNTYGHPAPETLDILSEAGIKTLRTDQKGNVEVVTDGTKWWIK